MQPLKFISYNIEIGKKFDEIVTWMTNLPVQPDIFCFQEFPEHKMSDFKKVLNKKGYASVYTPGTKIYGIQVGQLTAHREKTMQLTMNKGLILRDGDKYFNVRGYRSALVTTYAYNGIYFSVVNLHLTILSLNAKRIKQLNIVTDALQPKDEHVVIMGDFNYTSLLGIKKLLSAMSDAGFTRVGGKLITHKLFNHIPQQLDYVFQRGFVPQEITVLKVPHSDHLPVYTKLAILSR